MIRTAPGGKDSGMSMNERERMWQILVESSDLDARLQALGELELYLEPEGRLEADLTRFARTVAGPLSRAAGRSLLGVRRRSRHAEVLTAGSNSRIGDHRINEVLRGARYIFRDGDARTRIRFLQEAMRRELFEVGPALVAACVREKDEEILSRLAHAVGLLGNEGSLRTLARLGEHPSAQVRRGAVEGLSHQCGRQAVALLLGILADPDAGVRALVLEHLESFPAAEILVALEDLPESRRPRAGETLIPFLSKRKGSPIVQAILRSLARSANPGLRSQALSILGAIPTA